MAYLRAKEEADQERQYKKQAELFANVLRVKFETPLMASTSAQAPSPLPLSKLKPRSLLLHHLSLLSLLGQSPTASLLPSLNKLKQWWQVYFQSVVHRRVLLPMSPGSLLCRSLWSSLSAKMRGLLLAILSNLLPPACPGKMFIWGPRHTEGGSGARSVTVSSQGQVVTLCSP